MKYFGKYRGKVQNNVDPLGQGRIQVSCPLIFGDGQMSWALPCTPFAGPGVGFFAVPPVNANVWIELEGGDPDRPIWTGCFWGVGEAPAVPPLPQVVMLKTNAGTLTLSELPGVGGVTLETPSGMKISIGMTGIEINNGMGAKIVLTGPQVSVNDGALEVL